MPKNQGMEKGNFKNIPVRENRCQVPSFLQKNIPSHLEALFSKNINNH